MNDQPHADRDGVAEALDRYLDAPGLLHVFALPSRTGRAFTTDRAGIEGAVDYVIEQDEREPAGIYVRGTTVSRTMAADERGTDEDTSHWLGYQEDLDFGGPGRAPDAETVRQIVKAIGLPDPTVWHHSGHGLYARWDFTRPIPDGPEVRAGAVALHKAVAAAFTAKGFKIDTCTDPARVWRIPGTVNRKDPAEPVRAAIVEVTGTVHPWGDLVDALPTAEPAQPARDRVEPDERRFTMDQAAAFVKEQAIDPLLRAGEAGSGRNNKLNDAAYVVGHFVEGEFWSEEWAVERLAELAEEIGLDEAHSRSTIRSGLAAGMADKPDGKGERFGRCRKVEADPFTGTADAAELAALVRKMRLQRQARETLDAETRPPRRAAATTSLVELFAEPDDDTPDRIDGLWPADGKVLLTAPKKAGKTTLTGNSLRSLADGVAFLPSSKIGGFPGFEVTPVSRGGTIALLDFEMTRRKLRAWLRDQRIQNANAIHVELLRGHPWDIRDDQVRAEWVAHFRSLATEILLIDPIGPVLHGLGIEENSNSEVGRFLTCLDRLCAEAGIRELFVAHHAGHDGERARGASAFLGWPDAIWSLVRDEDARFFSAEGRDVLVPETRLAYDHETRRLGLGQQGGRRDARDAGHAATVAAIVAETSGLSWNDLKRFVKEALSIGTPAAEAAIKAARTDGLIHVHHGPNRAQHHHTGRGCDACPSK